jgi:hypothetical protein
MDTLNKAQTLSQDGKDWLTRALDPFHDTNQGLRGMPDHDTDPSALQYIRKKVTIRQPAGLTTETWSAHICTLPILETIPGVPLEATGHFRNFVYDALDGEDIQLGTVTVVTHEDGLAGWPNVPATGPITNQEWFAYSPTDGNENSMKKIIAGGFEVHNDTADLYRQGNVGVYESPQSISSSGTMVFEQTSGAERLGGARICRQPPSTVADMALHPTTRNWAAADGCYVPFRLDLSTRTEFQPGTNDTPVFLRTDNNETTNNTVGVMATQTAAPYESSFAMVCRKRWHQAALSTTGAYFSGLSPETVLTLDIFFIVEAAPTAANPGLLAMVSKTAPYDPVALRMYCNTLSGLPPGVPVSENAKGDWWRTVLKTAAKTAQIAAPVVAMTGHPVAASAIAAGGQLAGQVGRTKIKGNVHLRPNNLKRK